MPEWLINLVYSIVEHKVALVGAVGVVCEIIITAFNTIRKIFAHKNQKKLAVNAMKTKEKLRVKEVIVWSVNPLNLFRSPNK